jgi:general secretion pathway protein H
MPTSATGSKERGFTLVELLAVLAILAVASAAVVFTLPDSRGTVRGEAERFAARAMAARDLAIIDARPVRLTVNAQGYGVEERRGGAWKAVPSKAFQPVAWEADLQVAGQGAILFDPTGGTSDAFTVSLRRDESKASVSIDASGASHVSQ